MKIIVLNVIENPCIFNHFIRKSGLFISNQQTPTVIIPAMIKNYIITSFLPSDEYIIFIE